MYVSKAMSRLALCAGSTCLICPVLTGVFQLAVQPGRGVAAVCVFIVAIHDGVGWAAAICGIVRKGLEKCR